MTVCFCGFYFFTCACKATYVVFMKKKFAFLGEESPLISQTNHSLMSQDSSNSRERETAFTVPFIPSLSLFFILPSSFSGTEQ